MSIETPELKRGDCRRNQSNWRFSRALIEALRIKEMTRQISIRKSDNLFLLDNLTDNPLVVTMTLCPLYEPGSLSESRLMSSYEAAIEKSRVAVKWQVGLVALSSIKEIGLKYGYQIEARLTFADTGVISKNPESEDAAILLAHETVYQHAATRDLREGLGISYTWHRYSDFQLNLARFITASDDNRKLSINSEWGIRSAVLLRDNHQARSDLIDLIRRIRKAGVNFDNSMVDPETEGLTSQGENLIIKLMRQLDNSLGLTENLICQYGLFDAQTTKADSLNLFIERESAAPLLKLTDLFPHRCYPRLDILC